jgi:hypothetical protein
MKTKNNLSALRLHTFVVGLLATTAVFATTKSEVNLRTLNDSKKAVLYVNPENSASLTIEDQNGQSLFYSEYVSKGEKYSKTFDFSSTPDGIYNVKVESRTGMVLYRVQVNDAGILVLNDETALSPVFHYKGNALTVAFLNNTKQSVSLSINKGDEVLLHESGLNNDVVQKKYNISKLTSGLYSVAVSTNNNVYDYKFLVP